VGELIHFAVLDGGLLQPLCADAEHAANWTTERIVVTCRTCRALLLTLARRRGERPGAAPVKAATRRDATADGVHPAPSGPV